MSGVLNLGGWYDFGDLLSNGDYSLTSSTAASHLLYLPKTPFGWATASWPSIGDAGWGIDFHMPVPYEWT